MYTTHLYLQLFCDRKFLLDAMPHIRTADGVTLMIQLFKSDEISSAQMDSWLTSLAFQKKPTLNMMSSVLV
jgi:MarR-like DNA-binding transcriptional regulator SgrR of sgrS sRNA